MLRGGLDVEEEIRHEEVQKGTSKHDRLDVEAEGSHEKVQKGRENTVDWTLKQRKVTRKSKMEEQARQIGR